MAIAITFYNRNFRNINFCVTVVYVDICCCCLDSVCFDCKLVIAFGKNLCEVTVKAADAQYTYTFAGWDKEIVTVTGDVTYTAEFNKTVNKYTVTWSIDGNTETQTYEYGAMPEHAEPTKAADKQYTYTPFACR